VKNLVISAKTKDFRGDSPHPEKSNAEFSNIRPSILERDNYTCQYCGFRSKKFQHIHHLDDDHDNNSEKNLITACPLCHMSQHIGFAGVKGMGTLIYLEQESHGEFKLNLTQEKLNNLVRLLWVRQDDKINKEASIQATDYLKRLEQARVDADKVIGTCDPILVGNTLRELSEEDYLSRDVALGNVFFLPFKEGFLREHKYWKENRFNKVTKQDWSKIAKGNMFSWIEISKLKPNLEGIKRFLMTKKIY
jgi:intracellular multiplication protein IcmJ